MRPWQAAAHSGANLARRVGNGDVADEPRGPLRGACGGQFVQQSLVVGFVRGAGTGESRRKNAGAAAQSIDHQAAIVGQHPAAQMPCLRGGLQRGVGGERVAVFDDL